MKETIHKMKRQPTELEKIFVNDVCDKELISQIHKNTTQNQTNNLIKNGKNQEHLDGSVS